MPDSSPTKSRGISKWLPYVVAVIAVAGLAAGVAGWYLPKSGTSYSGDDTAKAKTEMCATFKLVNQSVVVNTHRINPGPKDPAGALAVAGNARLALYGGGDYLENRLTKSPATPADLAKAVGAAADTMQLLGIDYLADVPDDAMKPLRDSLNNQIADINKLCG